MYMAGGGGIGGGTIESGVNLMRENAVNGDPQAKQAMSHPYSLIPNFDDKVELNKLPDKGGSSLPAYSKAAQAWGAPFVMAGCNERVVRMSNALLGWKLGACLLHRASVSCYVRLSDFSVFCLVTDLENVLHRPNRCTTYNLNPSLRLF
jgi:short subunit dehydrogenase-like uncharacterized protein